MYKKLLLIMFIVTVSLSGNDVSNDPILLSPSSIDKQVELQSNSDEISTISPHDEYDKNDMLSEYEMQICDTCKPSVVSDWRALFTRIGGFVLIRYFIMQENIKRYYAHLRRSIYSLLNLI